MNKENVVHVWGAGVAGLTTGLKLAEQGYKVRITAAQRAQDTVSGVAAAVWFPYKAAPVEKVNEWSRRSYQEFKKLAEIKGSGVRFIPFTVYEKRETQPHWLTALPPGTELRNEERTIANLPATAYTMQLPLIETPVYLGYLQDEFKKAGGEIIYKTIHSITQLDSDAVTVNCLGLGSKLLFGDKEMTAIRGQILKLEPDAEIQGFSVEFQTDEFEDEHMYVIPRSDCIVVGGSSEPDNISTTPDSAQAKRILERAAELSPKLKNLKVLQTLAGLRPGRRSVRLEKDPLLPVIHNYGHGGAGFTVSLGCAEEVLTLMPQ